MDLLNEKYKNGQIKYKQFGDEQVHYYENGDVKAKGLFINNQMEGKWLFYKKGGHVFQEGNFLNHEKHGEWIRYDLDGNINYHETFEYGKKLKKNK